MCNQILGYTQIWIAWVCNKHLPNYDSGTEIAVRVRLPEAFHQPHPLTAISTWTLRSPLICQLPAYQSFLVLSYHRIEWFRCGSWIFKIRVRSDSTVSSSRLFKRVFSATAWCCPLNLKQCTQPRRWVWVLIARLQLLADVPATYQTLTLRGSSVAIPGRIVSHEVGAESKLFALHIQTIEEEACCDRRIDVLLMTSLALAPEVLTKAILKHAEITLIIQLALSLLQRV